MKDKKYWHEPEFDLLRFVPEQAHRPVRTKRPDQRSQKEVVLGNPPRTGAGSSPVHRIQKKSSDVGKGIEYDGTQAT